MSSVLVLHAGIHNYRTKCYACVIGGNRKNVVCYLNKAVIMEQKNVWSLGHGLSLCIGFVQWLAQDGSTSLASRHRSNFNKCLKMMRLLQKETLQTDSHPCHPVSISSNSYLHTKPSRELPWVYTNVPGLNMAPYAEHTKLPLVFPDFSAQSCIYNVLFPKTCFL